MILKNRPARIQFTFVQDFTGETIQELSIPYNPQKCINGFYRRFLVRVKPIIQDTAKLMGLPPQYKTKIQFIGKYKANVQPTPQV